MCSLVDVNPTAWGPPRPLRAPTANARPIVRLRITDGSRRDGVRPQDRTGSGRAFERLPRALQFRPARPRHTPSKHREAQTTAFGVELDAHAQKRTIRLVMPPAMIETARPRPTQAAETAELRRLQ